MKKVLVSMLLAVLLLGLLSGVVAAIDVVDVDIDITPCKDPNILNLNVTGWLPVAVYTPDAIADVTLNDVFAIDYIDRGDYWLVKFDAVEVIESLEGIPYNKPYQITLEGSFVDNGDFFGTDTVTIIKRGRR